MAANIQIKRSTGSSAPSSLLTGELAYSHGDDKFYIGDGTTVKVIGGKSFNDKIDHTAGILTASSAVIVDSNSAIDDFYVGNAAATGGSLKLNEGTNNGSNYIAFKAPDTVTASTTLTFPDGAGSNLQFLQTDGNGNLSWATASSTLSVDADTGSTETINLSSETLDIAGGSNITTTVSSNQVSVDLDANITVTSAAAGNVSISGNTISSTDTDGSITLDPDGNGNINLNASGTGVISANSVRITDLATPTASSDAATKEYVDAVAEGLHVHESVVAATTDTLANLSSQTVTYSNGTNGVGATLSIGGANALTAIDGVTLSNGDRVLVKNESTAANNGIYTYNNTSGTIVLTRASDFNTPTEIAGGDFLFVTGGTSYDSTGWVQTEIVGTVGTDTIAFSQFSGVGSFTAGNGLDLTGSEFSVVGTTNRISVSGSGVDIASTYVGQTSITTLGTIGTGTWNGTEIGVAYGGTGLTTAAQGSVLVANAADTFTALDGGGSNDGVLFYSQTGDTISWATSLNVSFLTGTLPVTNGGTGLNTVSTGDILYGSAANTISALSAGTDGNFLVQASGVPSWTDTIDGGTF
jgi:hypothetical protein